MALFQKNVNSDLLVAIEYTKVLFSCNYGLESVVFDISKKKFGSVTETAKEIVIHVRAGKTMQEGLLQAKAAAKNKNMQYFIGALGGVNTQDTLRRLDDVGKHIVAEKKLYVENFIDNLKSKMNWLVILMALPMLVYFVMELSTETFKMMIPAFSPSIKPIIYAITLGVAGLAMFVILALLRYKE